MQAASHGVSVRAPTYSTWAHKLSANLSPSASLPWTTQKDKVQLRSAQHWTGQVNSLCKGLKKTCMFLSGELSERGYYNS